MKIDTRLLGITATDPTGLVTSEGPVRIELVTKHPFSSDHISAGRTREEIPGMIEKERAILVFHGAKPMRVQESSLVGRGNRGVGEADAVRLRRSIGRPNPALL